MTFLEKAKRFFEPMKQDKLIYFWWTLQNFFWSLDTVIHVLFLERIIHFLEIGDGKTFLFIIQIYIAYVIFYTLFIFLLKRKGWSETIPTTGKYIQKKYLKDFVQMNNNYVEKYGTGKLTAIIKTGQDTWSDSLTFTISRVIGIVVSFVFTGYMILKSGFLFFAVFVFVYFSFYVISYILNILVIKHRKNRREAVNNHTKNLVKILMNKQEILQSQKISHELSILGNYKSKEMYYSKNISSCLAGLYEGPNIVGTIAIIGVAYYFGNIYLDGNIQISVMVGIISALIMMKSALDKGIQFFKDFTKDFTDIDKLWEFFDETPKIQGYETGEDFIYKKGDIEIKNIDYSYVEGKKILENFSLSIAGGKVIAFVGNSGGGKSTLAKLLAGYISCESGKIEIDRQDLSQVSLKSYYKNIGFLTQEPSVFDGSVLENLCYALETEPAQEQIDEIVKLAKCEFIYDLPNGLETEIGERGVKLSGGQRQRLAIAKIMLKNPKIIILDEPTSALDSFSEEKITKAMDNLFEKRTVIVIAHRLQTVKNADKIFVIESGKVVEEGTHRELQKQKGVYYKMLELQSGF